MSELKLVLREPYPVYRSLRVPIWEDERVVSIRRVSAKDVERFEKALKELREVLVSVGSFSAGLGECERLRRLADAVAIFYKAPLVQEVSPVAPTPTKAYILTLLLGDTTVLGEEELDRVVKDPFEFSRVIAGRDFGKLVGSLPVAKLLSRDIGELVYSMWIAFPADTRPGYNTSSLIAHLLLTSAVAWALNYGVDACEEGTIRLAALLHDIGKASDPERHVEESLRIADYLLSGVVPPDRLDEVKKLIKTHHEVDSPLKSADEVASEADRLNNLVREVLGPRLEALEKLIGKRRDSWDFWKNLYSRREELRERDLVLTEDPVRELSETFLREVTRRKVREVSAKELPELKVVLVDIASIQDFVYRAQELKAVAAASSIVDLITQAHILIYLRSQGFRVPPEAVVYSGGGNILMIVPGKEVQRVLDYLEDYSKNLQVLGSPLSINYSVANFSSNYQHLSRTLGEGLALRKVSVRLRHDIKEIVGDRDTRAELCRLCYSDLAVEHVETPEGRVPVCRLCNRLYELGVEIHFSSKWSSEISLAGDSFSAREAFERDWKEVSKWIMEIVSGHDPEELPNPPRLRDYSVVKFDGNLIGSFMLDSISFTDAVERSFRIDLATKRAYFRALEALYEALKNVKGKVVARREVARVFLGTAYMGGDDGLLIVPSWVSIPLAQLLAEEFARELGLARGLVVAVTGGHARMNLWLLIDCASELMERAKGVARTAGSAVVFDLYEGTTPSGKEAVERLAKLSRRLREHRELAEVLSQNSVAESSQPYLTVLEDLSKGLAPELWGVLSIVLNTNLVNSPWTREVAVRAYSKAVLRCFQASRRPDEGEEDMHEYLRSLRRAILDSIREASRFRQVRGPAYAKELLYLYVHKARKERASSEGAEGSYAKLLDLLNRNLFDSSGKFNAKGSTALADLLVLIKFAKGGAW